MKYMEKAKAMTTEELEDARFYLSMKDRWNADDFAWDDAMFIELMNRRNQKNRG